MPSRRPKRLGRKGRGEEKKKKVKVEVVQITPKKKQT